MKQLENYGVQALNAERTDTIYRGWVLVQYVVAGALCVMSAWD